MIEICCSYVLIALNNDIHNPIPGQEGHAQPIMNTHERGEKEVVEHVQCVRRDILKLPRMSEPRSSPCLGVFVDEFCISLLLSPRLLLICEVPSIEMTDAHCQVRCKA